METKISQFLASYRSTPHSATGRTPAEIILGRLPRTRLSLIHPCLPQRMSIAIEERVGHRAPRNFDKGQKVLLRDLRPYAPQKWRHAIISCKQGPLTYKVIVDGVVRQAHVDHLQPCPDVEPQEIQDAPSATLDDDEDPSNTFHPFGVGNNDDIDQQHTQDTPQLVEPVQRLHHNCQPPKRLIEEMD